MNIEGTLTSGQNNGILKLKILRELKYVRIKQKESVKQLNE